jgi:hypothetical protein
VLITWSLLICETLDSYESMGLITFLLGYYSIRGVVFTPSTVLSNCSISCNTYLPSWFIVNLLGRSKLNSAEEWLIFALVLSNSGSLVVGILIPDD